MCVARTTPEQLEATKLELLRQMQGGKNVKSALEVVGRTRSTYERWRKDDPDFVIAVDQVNDGELGQLPEEEQKARRQTLQNGLSSSEYVNLRKALRARAAVEIYTTIRAPQPTY